MAAPTHQLVQVLELLKSKETRMRHPETEKKLSLNEAHFVARNEKNGWHAEFTFESRRYTVWIRGMNTDSGILYWNSQIRGIIMGARKVIVTLCDHRGLDVGKITISPASKTLSFRCTRPSHSGLHEWMGEEEEIAVRI
ncbi:hypothetical protein CBL_06090 [Carabus blaptoides fortunei]